MVDAIGAKRVAIRLSPWSKYLGMGMDDAIPQYSQIIRKVNDLKIAYIHLVESRVKGGEDFISVDKLDFAYQLFSGPAIVAGGYTGESARRFVDDEFPNSDIAVAFGRHFIANPDLVFRIRQRLSLNTYDRSSFYALKEPKGYLDYSFSKEYLATVEA